jgi:hypothetical protein
MSYIRTAAIVVASLVMSVAGAVVAAPAAFAMRLVQPEGVGGPSVPSAVLTHAGMAGWAIAVIAVLAATVAAAAPPAGYRGTRPMLMAFWPAS